LSGIYAVTSYLSRLLTTSRRRENIYCD
jgi:hypothetical protein